MTIKIKSFSSGIGLIGYILMIPAALIVLAVGYFIYCELNKAYWDRKVDELCEKNGGIRIYERVHLPRSRFDKWGNLSITSKDRTKDTDEYYFKRVGKYYKKWSPSVWMSRHKILRKKDNKVLGESIRYIRRGGDMLGVWHESSYMCPHINGESSLESKIFISEGDEK